MPMEAFLRDGMFWDVREGLTRELEGLIQQP